MAGTITPYETKAGVRYRVRYRKPDGAQTDKRGFTTKRDARLYLSTIDVSKASGHYTDPTEGRRTVKEYGLKWKESHLPTLKKSSAQTMEIAWRVHVEPEWGHRQVSSIKPSEVTAWTGRLITGAGDKKPLSAQTVRRCVFVLSLVLDLAKNDRVLLENPARGHRLPAKVRKPIVYLTHKQVELLASKSTRPDLIRFLAYTGLRWGEASALQVKHIDFKRKRMQIESNAVLVNGAIVFGTPKTGEARSVPIIDFIEFALRRLTKDRPQEGFVFGGDKNPLPRPHAEYSWFASAVRAAQGEDDTFPRVTPHDLRHTAASLAVSAGANPKAVQRMLGHKSAAMTMDIYSALFEQDLDDVAVSIDAARTAALSA